MKYIIKNLYIAMIMALLLNSYANAEEKTSQPVVKMPVYKIGPGDVLEISVWKEEGLQKQITVRPDGGISFPLVGEIQAGGQSVAQIEKLLIQQINRFIPDPVVTVIVLKATSNHIFVIGKVQRPSMYESTSYLDVMQALAMAGGLNAFAKPGDIKILRRTNNGPVAISFEYDEVASGDDLKQNIILQSGDVVVVP